MLTAWRYDSDTNEVAVPRSYDPAKGRSSKIQACTNCRQKKTRCDGDGHDACNRCRCKGLTCEYKACSKSTKSARLSKSSIEKPRRQHARKSSLLSTRPLSHADYDSSDTFSDKTASPNPCQLGPLDVFDTFSGGVTDHFAIDPLLLQDVQQYTAFEPCPAEFGGNVELDMQYFGAGNDLYDVSQLFVSHAHGHEEGMTHYGQRWLPNGLA